MNCKFTLVADSHQSTWPSQDLHEKTVFGSWAGRC